ncbi:MAG: hemerythrin domain-containing protein [Thermoplasmatota archaeon]
MEARPTSLSTLHKEHESIRQLLHVISGMAGAMREGHHVERSDADQALEAVVGFADKCHHAKEENILFPAIMDSRQAAFAKRLLPSLERDHGVSRRIVNDMKTHLPAAVGGDARAMALFTHAVHQFRLLEEAHIKREERELMPLAESLSPRALGAVLKAFEKLDLKLGAGLHAKFEGWIHDLAGKYARFAVAAA